MVNTCNWTCKGLNRTSNRFLVPSSFLSYHSRKKWSRSSTKFVNSLPHQKILYSRSVWIPWTQIYQFLDSFRSDTLIFRVFQSLSSKNGLAYGKKSWTDSKLKKIPFHLDYIIYVENTERGPSIFEKKLSPIWNECWVYSFVVSFR